MFWILLTVAFAGTASWVAVQITGHWSTGLASALWVTIGASLFLFAWVSALTPQGWRLTPLLVPYLFILGVIATVWLTVPGKMMAPNLAMGWVAVHIVLSVITYALVTIASVAALAAFLQERALKNKRPTTLSRLLPSVIDSEKLLVRLLVAAETVLGFGVVSGMALQYETNGSLLTPDHKTLLSLAAFVVIGALLLAHRLTGVRGKAATRLVLLAYLLLTLGYPGVKFITSILIGK
ncbi:MAG: cytochrome c biogenesis protein CcsA [Rhodospirillales bacterium]|nr:cytochrome c biogenesis protein CcsA [Rhodospirillales bacterium]MCW8862929.1 cytochrome c biogenesis protein CcsA [Rhodospirillales bacterium]MCW8952621.1 cytochrome c biogenesis protein CcsA [Rhodospirillales bacterium]